MVNDIIDNMPRIAYKLTEKTALNVRRQVRESQDVRSSRILRLKLLRRARTHHVDTHIAHTNPPQL